MITEIEVIAAAENLRHISNLIEGMIQGGLFLMSLLDESRGKEIKLKTFIEFSNTLARTMDEMNENLFAKTARELDL